MVALWREVFPPSANIPKRDIAIKLTVQPELFLVAVDGEELIGTAMVGFDGHRGWLNYLAVKPSHRRRGIGSALVQQAEADLSALGCPKLNLQVRADNDAVVAFYRRHGFEIEPRISMGKRLDTSCL